MLTAASEAVSKKKQQQQRKWNGIYKPQVFLQDTNDTGVRGYFVD